MTTRITVINHGPQAVQPNSYAKTHNVGPDVSLLPGEQRDFHVHEHGSVLFDEQRVSSTPPPKAVKELPRYQSHKEVQAFKIEAIKQIEVPTGADLCYELQGITADLIAIVGQPYLDKHVPEDGSSMIGGYYVRYADGYQSWSPAKAFEDGYQSV